MQKPTARTSVFYEKMLEQFVVNTVARRFYSMYFYPILPYIRWRISLGPNKCTEPSRKGHISSCATIQSPHFLVHHNSHVRTETYKAQILSSGGESMMCHEIVFLEHFLVDRSFSPAGRCIQLALHLTCYKEMVKVVLPDCTASFRHSSNLQMTASAKSHRRPIVCESTNVEAWIASGAMTLP